MDSDALHIPLVVAALVFAAFMVWRLRPSFAGGRESVVPGPLLREFQARIEAAATDSERAIALCDAGDACAQRVGRRAGAVGFYLRAMRADPSSAAIVERAARGLARRPRALESVLWRRLGAEAWNGESRAAVKRALEHLGRLYAGPLRNPARAKAMEHAAALVDGGVRSSPEKMNV